MTNGPMLATRTSGGKARSPGFSVEMRTPLLSAASLSARIPGVFLPIREEEELPTTTADKQRPCEPEAKSDVEVIAINILHRHQRLDDAATVVWRLTRWEDNRRLSTKGNTAGAGVSPRRSMASVMQRACAVIALWGNTAGAIHDEDGGMPGDRRGCHRTGDRNEHAADRGDPQPAQEQEQGGVDL